MLVRLLSLLPSVALTAACTLLPASPPGSAEGPVEAVPALTVTPAADPAVALEEDAPLSAGIPLTPQQRNQLQVQIMAGEMAAGRGQPGVAAEAFLRALALQPDPALAARATQLALVSGRLKTAESAASRWLQIQPNALEAREVLARLALEREDTAAAYDQALAIVEGHAGGPEEGLRHVALLMSSDADHGDEVMQLMDRLVAGFDELAGAHYARALVAMRFDRLDQAEASARRALSLRPASRDYRLLLVGVLTRDGRSDQADPLIAGLLGEAENAGQRGEIHMTYARLLLDAGNRDHARTQIRAALDAEPDNQDARYALGVMAFTDGELDAAEGYFTPLTADVDRGGDAWYQLGRIAEARRDLPLALDHYRKVVTGNQAIEAAVRQASVMTRLGQADEGRNLLDQLRRQFPPLGPRLTRAEAEMLVEANLDEAALGVYKSALTHNADDESLLYGRSLVYEKLGRFPDAERDLRRILEQDPENPRALNALGYMLTVNTTRYDEAHRLIEAALRQDPDDAAVIDSMGWVLFKLGQPDAALRYLERALAKADDPEISAHLGEVLWTLGQQERAREVLERALTRDPDHRVLRETVDRLMR